MTWHKPKALRATTVCGKAAYLKPDAERRAKAMRDRYTEVLTVYRCQLCKSWHIGHARG